MLMSHSFSVSTENDHRTIQKKKELDLKDLCLARYVGPILQIVLNDNLGTYVVFFVVFVVGNKETSETSTTKEEILPELNFNINLIFENMIEIKVLMGVVFISFNPLTKRIW